jgi:hypothetical protein
VAGDLLVKVIFAMLVWAFLSFALLLVGAFNNDDLDVADTLAIRQAISKLETR